MVPLLTTFARKLRNAGMLFQRLGVIGTLLYKLHSVRKPSRYGVFTLYSKHARYALSVRSGTSDLDLFRDIFISREYRCLDDLLHVGLIIDCGANVGYSSAYFLSRFPEATVIAIEPDPENFQMLELNLKRYSGRYHAMQCGVWCDEARLAMSELPFRDGREWSRQVRLAAPTDSSSIQAVSIDSLLRGSSFDRISLLKIDIEGAEVMLFSKNYHTWIDKVDTLVIELHDDECRRVFSQAIADAAFSVSRCDELHVCRAQ